MLFFPSSPPNYPIRNRLQLPYLIESERDDLPLHNNVVDYGYDINECNYEYCDNFEREEPEYPDDMPVFGRIQKGKTFDVISMLSTSSRDYLVHNNGDRVLVESLRGKYVLICCYFVPVLSQGEVASTCFHFIATYSQLSVERPGEFEMVVVAKMRKNIVDGDEDAFNHFFSGFSCLAIPFWDLHSRDRVCKTIQSDSHFSWMGTVSLIVDPHQTVLQYLNYDFFEDYGGYAFPFTDERIDFINKEDYEMRLRLKNTMIKNPEIDTPSLDELLCLNSSHRLKKNNVDEFASVLDLSKKIVGLYLCYDGDFLATLNFFYQRCLARGLEFEVMLVYLPYTGDITWFQNRVNAALVEFNISWWILPYNDFVSRRLHRFCPDIKDKLMILGPNSAFVDTYGREVMSRFGIRSYPFTREGILERKLTKLRAVTLESLLTLSDEQNYVVNKDGERVFVADLVGRNIFLYLDHLNRRRRGLDNEQDLYNRLLRWYPEFKAKDPDFEVVFVAYNSEDEVEIDERFHVMPWLAFPFPSSYSKSVTRQLDLEREDEFSALIAFGKDGHIRSRRAAQHLISGTDEFPLQDHLREDIACEFIELDTLY